MADMAHRVLAVAVLLALAMPEAAAGGATTNLQIPRVTTPRVVPHTTPPGGVRDPTIPEHRM